MRGLQQPLPLLPLVLDDVPVQLRELLVQEGVPFSDRREQPRAGRFVLFDSRRRRRQSPERGQTWIDVDPLRAISSKDPLAELADWKSARFEWRLGATTLTEEIARVDRRAVRRQVLSRLRAAVEEAGGVWLCISAYPFPYRSATNFRMDYDEYEPADFEAVMRAIDGHEGCTSHFVSGAAYESVGEAWTRLGGLDVGSHGYRHHTYRTVEENLRNIGRGIEVIRRAGIEPRGFAAPHGRFSPELHTALAELRISHSGEFGLAYDELPLRFSPGGPLQIPVHPVCLGLFLEAAERRGSGSAALAEAGDYYDELIHDRYAQGEPIFLYGHPTGRLGRYPEVLRRVLETVDSLAAVWKTTQSNWAAWWQARRQVRLTMSEHEGRFVVTAKQRPANWDFALEYWRGEHVALMPLDTPAVRFTPAALAYESRRARPGVRPVRVDRPQGLKAHLRRAIDWERITPLDEIGRTGWRNRVKRTFRKWTCP